VRPAAQPERYRTLDEFLRVAVDGLGAIRPVNPREAARSVFAVLGREPGASSAGQRDGEIGNIYHLFEKKADCRAKNPTWILFHE
jgi:hypothetical protein